jgi:hypothetical protein
MKLHVVDAVALILTHLCNLLMMDVAGNVICALSLTMVS